MLKLRTDDIEAHFGSVTAFDERIAAFSAAVADHATTVDVPAPTEHGIIEEIVRRHGGKYERVDASEVVAKGLTFEQMRDAKLAEIAAFRWQSQNIGVTFNEHRVGSDAGTLGTILAYLLSGKTEPLNFKVGPTTFAQVSRVDAEQLMQQIQDHVQSCFAWEADMISRVMKARSKKQIAEIGIE